MKKLILIMAAFLFSITIQSQQQQVQKETQVTKKTVRDSKGARTTVKQAQIEKTQNIELQRADSRTLNKDMKETPVEENKVTTVINPDGSTRTVDIDRSAYYTSNGRQFKLDLDVRGYKIVAEDNTSALLRRTSTNSFIYRSGNQTSIGYFDMNGNLVLETYDDKLDKVDTQTFLRMK